MTSDILIIVGRLNAGWIMCNREADPDKRARMENHWIALLHQYEAMCDHASMVTGQIGVAA